MIKDEDLILSMEITLRVPKHERQRVKINISGSDIEKEKDVMALMMGRLMCVAGRLWPKIVDSQAPEELVTEIDFYAEAAWQTHAGVKVALDPLRFCTLKVHVESESIDEQVLHGLVATFGQRVYMFALSEQM